jgi:WD40 repeat protein
MWTYPAAAKTTGSQRVRLRSGAYVVFLSDDDDRFELSQSRFILGRGGKVVVKVRRKGLTSRPNDLLSGTTPRRLTEIRRFAGAVEAIKQVVWFADGGRAAASSLDGAVYVWDAETGELKQTLRVGRPLAGLAVSPDGRYAVVGFDHGSDGAIEVWSLETGAKQGTLEAHTSRVTELHFSPDGKRLMSAGYDRVMRVWDFENRRLLREFPVRIPDSVALSPDGRFVAGRDAEDERLVRNWSAESGASLHTWNPFETGLPLRATFSSDSSRLVTGSDRGKVQVWDISAAKELLRFNAHGGPVIDALLTPDDRLLITAGDEGRLRIWDAKSGNLLAETQSDTWRFRHLALSPDGRRILAGGGWKWDARSRELLTDGDFDVHLYCIPDPLVGGAEAAP